MLECRNYFNRFKTKDKNKLELERKRQLRRRGTTRNIQKLDQRSMMIPRRETMIINRSSRICSMEMRVQAKLLMILKMKPLIFSPKKKMRFRRRFMSLKKTSLLTILMILKIFKVFGKE